MTTVLGRCSTLKGFTSDFEVFPETIASVGSLQFKCRQPSGRNLLTTPASDGSLRPSQNRLMSKVCSITGSKPSRGSVIHRRGMAKKKGGVGRHVTKNVPRTFNPNLHEHRIWVAELKKFVRIKVSARGLKTINKNGAYATLKKAGLIAN